MTQHAEARNFENYEPAELPVGEHLARTAHVVAAGHDAHLNRAAVPTVPPRRRSDS